MSLNSTNSIPVLRMSSIGGLANRMIEYIFALSLKRLVPELVIANMSIPEWDIHCQDLPISEPALILPNTMRIGVEELASEIRSRGYRWISYPGYAQHMDNFLKYREYFTNAFPVGVEEGFGADEIVINIRGAEILDGRHPGYILLPISFYRATIELTGLKPVFFGQLEENVYVDALRSSFPEARFVGSRGPLADFDILRKSCNIVPAISTFSWLAAWLSSATVHLAVAGLFNPFQEKEHHLLPLDEGRYRFYHFPLSYSVPVHCFRDAHAPIEGRWAATSAEVLRWRMLNGPRMKAEKYDYVYALQPEFYIAHHNDLKIAFRNDNLGAQHHYIEQGFSEKRSGFPFDERKYVTRYPDAALAVGKGEFASAIDHYLLIGRKFGYVCA